jgi:hypothetical protein
VNGVSPAVLKLIAENDLHSRDQHTAFAAYSSREHEAASRKGIVLISLSPAGGGNTMKMTSPLLRGEASKAARAG